MAKCVYCENTDTLNTQLTIKLDDGTKATVDICDEHAEDATIKTARVAYQETQDKIAAFMEQAKALGLTVSEGTGGLAIAQAPAEPPYEVPALVEQQIEQSVVPVAEPNVNPKAAVTSEEKSEGWVDTGVVDSQKGMQSVGGATGMGSVQGHASHVVGGQQDRLPQGTRRGKVKMQLVEGRNGQPLALPEKRVDGTGTTRIKIVKAVDDNVLQRNFKDMADTSRSSHDNASGPDFRNGYNDATRSCPICRGDCVVNGKDCPKCDGMGFIQVG